MSSKNKNEISLHVKNESTEEMRIRKEDSLIQEKKSIFINDDSIELGIPPFVFCKRNCMK
ncbi:MAG: hypothetical protein DSZ03_04575 [Sulfurimonas sp.]|nr:MAG: hypothetical protein DSZ03_04575 [Sulfurimonas sp.]